MSQLISRLFYTFDHIHFDSRSFSLGYIQKAIISGRENWTMLEFLRETWSASYIYAISCLSCHALHLILNNFNICIIYDSLTCFITFITCIFLHFPALIKVKNWSAFLQISMGTISTNLPETASYFIEVRKQ